MSLNSSVYAQQTSSGQNVLSREPSGLINVAEVGTVVDTVNVWGSVNRTGRYVIPKGLNIPQLLSYAGGVGSRRNGNHQLEWIKDHILIRVNRYVPGKGKVQIKSFKSDFKQALPPGLFKYKLHNEDIVTVQVRRKPNFWDYLERISPIIGIITSGIVLFDHFK
ncbi:MAG TPA: hypothetical protein VE868_13120 [Balneolaceae bacterium]|nr:hypothetical protein [Balneolaceae bacterium]